MAFYLENNQTVCHLPFKGVVNPSADESVSLLRVSVKSSHDSLRAHGSYSVKNSCAATNAAMSLAYEFLNPSHFGEGWV
jgi:hypothetical protein